MSPGPIELGPLELALAGALLAVNAALSLALQLGLERKLVVAALRATVQLSLLGLVMVPVFSLGHPLPVLGLAAVMLGVAGLEATRRVSRRARGVLLGNVLAISLAALVTTSAATALILRVDPWWSPRYFIPMLGMILGNSLTGVSLGVDQTLRQLEEQRDAVEALLAFGATRWEAARPIAAEALRTGMVPILNTMSVVGLVTIPGMMTGQILGGTEPGLAARYQLLILFLIAASVAIGTTVAVLLAARLMFDAEHRLRLDRLDQRSNRPTRR
ncbi:MAG: iron export ABC transporter permease subunit FetB [Alphaproteobacteria bacterium]|nr:iron export ABC transporter permease subunit FetB [Alphaproteobacteria bacterium]MCB9794712.1 iron export ABC transporter permease subunit FetB [Alphaproteobacteria bacterium]